MAGKYKQVIKAFYAEPCWALLPEKYDEICEFLAAKHSGVMWSQEEIQAIVETEPWPYAWPLPP